MSKQSADFEKKQNSVRIILFFVLLILASVLLSAVVILAKKQSQTDAAAMQAVPATEEADIVEKWQEGVVSYNGARYRYNTSIDTYLFMGIDKEGTVQAVENGIDGGQSDAMFLLVIDHNAEKISVVAINRNTMTDVDVYNEDGVFIATETLQICLQHGYGDGMRLSCSRSVDAVSRLFYQIPISGYFALNMDGMPVLNDAVGGVTVEVLEDMESSARGVSLTKGDVVTLTGDEAYVYLRSRDTEEFDSATRRLERQMQYISSLLDQIQEGTGGSVSGAMKIYDALEDYLVSNIDFAELAEDASDYGFDASDMYSVPGETIMGERFEEYYVDETALYEMILEVFYEPAEE